MKEVDVVLVSPNTQGSYKFSDKPRETLALGCLDSYLNQHGINTEIIDARFDNLTQSEVADGIKTHSPKVVGITFMEQEPALWSMELVDRIKEDSPDTHITVGSYFPTLNPSRCVELLPGIDSIVQGEGEETIADLTLKTINNQDWSSTHGTVAVNQGNIDTANPRRDLIPNLDSLPKPTRYVDGARLSKVALEGSRGCYSACTFCSINPHLDPSRSTWRGKSPGKIIDELVDARNTYPDINQVRFVDADFLGLGKYHERIKLLAQGMLNAGFSSENTKIFIETQSKNALGVPPEVWDVFQQAGLHQVFLGVESGSEVEKKCINKTSTIDDDNKAIELLREHGINVTYGFIMINPWTDIDQVYENADTLRKLGNSGLDKYFSEMILNPGTRAFERASMEDGVYIETVEGIDRYQYPLPNSIESLRRISHMMLEDPNYRTFLIENSAIYQQIIDIKLKTQDPSLDMIASELDQINDDIFSNILSNVQQSPDPLTDTQIKIVLDQILNIYKKQLSQIQIKLAK